MDNYLEFEYAFFLKINNIILIYWNVLNEILLIIGKCEQQYEFNTTLLISLKILISKYIN